MSTWVRHICLCAETDASCPQLPSLFLFDNSEHFKICFSIILTSVPVFQAVSFLRVSLPKTCVNFTSHPVYLILDDFIILLTHNGGYKSCSFLICRFLPALCYIHFVVNFFLSRVTVTPWTFKVILKWFWRKYD